MIKKHQESWYFPRMSCGNVLMHLQCEKVLNDIEWTGWLQWMRNFRRSLKETWKQIKSDR
ncbi:hypothetical protein [Nitrososphaera sp. AFS]|uniref:hypothetical protein n=1 Tax=Nitrososphaera sp. AFS TaxID=2301191 RepID=UPI001F1F4011|nr:hypothetical protein [Nitrososphaera sp. AFS]NAL78895.1 hypothetical protein [Nitrososphaera sp. AFS]